MFLGASSFALLSAMTPAEELPPQPEASAVEAYHQQIVLRDGQPTSLCVRDAGNGRGKGIFVEKAFKKGDVLFRERPLAGMQHVASQQEALVCAHCHRFIGTVEQQIAHLLMNVITGLAQIQGADVGGAGPSTGASTSAAVESSGAGTSTSKQAAAGEDGGSSEDDQEIEDEELEELKERMALLQAHVSESDIQQLASGQLKLPHSDQIQLPQPIPCRHACGQQFCSTACEEAAWHAHHCLLCPSPQAHPEAAQPQPAQASIYTVDSAALAEFYQHAAATNDIFILAARVVAMTGLKAEALLASRATANGGSSSGEAAVAPAAAEAVHAALRDAWLPFAVGWKRVWWESVAVPEDVEDEQEFRGQLRELADSSLHLLRRALPGVVHAFPSLLSLTTWGSLVGLFELNNLALAVPSPVEDYFLLVDGLPEPQKAAAQQHSSRWLDALDKWYDTVAQGTGFYALQSCANHSCEPCAATEGEASGEVAVYAVRDIRAGEEVTISYIEEDEEQPLKYKERQAALRDYGFVCACGRCVRELQRVAARKLGGGGKGARAGVKTGRR